MCRVRGCIDRIWCMLMVVLIVSSIVYIMEVVVFNNILEIFIFWCFYGVDNVVFLEYFVNSNGFISFFFEVGVMKFY